MRIQIPHSRPTIDREDIEAVANVLASGNIAQGEKVKEFEDAIAALVGVKHGVAVSSGTSALHLALLALHIARDDEVIMPSYVCSSPFLSTLHCNSIPVLVDIDLSDFNISSRSVKQNMSPRTKAIIVPHMFGTPAELDEIRELKVPIIEDCAQSIGADYNCHQVGSLGALSIFSFYATKMITTGEGGMVLTNDSDLYNTIFDLRDYDKKPLAPPSYNYKMTNFQAALGLSQLRKLQLFIEKRRRIASLYNERFSNYNVKIPRLFEHKRSVFYRYILQVDRIEHVQKTARENGVMCERPVFEPLHKSTSRWKCPNSDIAQGHALSVPLYPRLTETETEHILGVLGRVLD